MYNLLITDDLSPQAIERLEAADDIRFDLIRRPSPEKLRDILPGYDALIIRSSVRVSAGLLATTTRLKVIGRAGMGLDNVDIDAASLRGVIVMNTPGANTIATAEHAVAMLLALCRHVPQADAALRREEWARSRFMGVQLYRKTLGVLGLGRVGTQVARRCQAFGMRVIGFDPYITDEAARELRVTLVELDQLFASSDFISLHTALTPETRGMINQRSITKMKPGVRLVNCARGGLVDETALIEALRSGQIAGAALDVFAEEPLPPESPLRALDNVVITPHIAASTLEAQRDVGTQIVDQVLAALRGEDYRNAVNVPMVDAGVLRLLRPYLMLAEKLGSLQMQLAEGPIKRVEVEFQGEEVADHVKPLTVALLKGMLDPIADEPVNYISAPHLAMHRGISVSETRGLPTPNYANLLSCRVLWDGGARLVSGSLLGHEVARVVQIDAFRIDAQPEGLVLVMESVDAPGVIGRVGTLLGARGINIAEWRLGRLSPGGQALSFINLDVAAPASVLDELVQLEGVTRVRQVRL
jgi:D-3-phosphoglycerate dehydrogenase